MAIGAPAPAQDSSPPAPTIDVATFEAAPGPPPTFPRLDSASPPVRVVSGPWETRWESICGPASKENWKPMTLGTFSSEGWDEPFVNAPAGTNGAPKQN